jgi:hypothetical protein
MSATKSTNDDGGGEKTEVKAPTKKPSRPDRIALHEILAADDGTGFGPNLTAAVSAGTPNCG